MLPKEIKANQSKQIASVLAGATKRTNKSEKVMIKELTRVYKESLKDVQGDITDFILKHGTDGVISPAQAYSFDRLAKLEKTLNSKMNELNYTANKLTDNHLTNTFKDNFYSTGFVLESAGQFKIGYSKLNNDAVREAIHRPLDKLAINNNAKQVKSNMQRSLATSVAQGESISKTSKRIRKDLETNANNALRIAQTEQGRVLNTARFNATQNADNKGLVIMKTWLATLDDRTRDRHAELDGEQVKQNETFSNGLLYPSDPSGSAEQVINCRCDYTEEIQGYPSEASERSARDAITGKSKVIDATSVEQWKKERLRK